MWRLKLISALIGLTSLMACDSPATFTTPQPDGVENLSEFPGRLQGHYASTKDSSTLSISAHWILRIYDFDKKIDTAELGSSARLSGDTLFDLNTNHKTLLRREGDSLMAYVHYIDTLFQMTRENMVRKFKGYYFLNQRYGDVGWEVRKMQLSKGELLISSISAEQDVAQLKEITETSLDTVPPYKFIVTKRQFRKFVRNKGFSDGEVFIRQK